MRRILRASELCLFAGIFLLVFRIPGVSADPWIQVPGVIHVHSTFSSGSDTIKQLVARAKADGLGCLILTDHDRVVMEYGIFPFRNLLKIRKQRRSVLSIGIEKYLNTISDIDHRQSDVLVIPGVQCSPFYYWTGNPLTGTLTAHDFRKELLLIGMKKPSDYKQIPTMYNGFSLRYTWVLLPRFLFFFAVFVLSLLLMRQPGWFRRAGLVMAVVSFLLMINDLPFQSSRFDPYHGDQGIAPYQDVINYVDQRGGMAFWAHPESNYASKARALGPILLRTPHYPEALEKAVNYTGFEAIYGDTVTITKPERMWDQVLLEYCAGFRKQPVWGLAGADFHGESAGVRLDTYQTVFLVHKKSVDGILAALHHGRCYAVLKKGGARLSLDRFDARNDKTGATAIMGETLTDGKPPVIDVRICATDNGKYPVRVTLILKGESVHVFGGDTPYQFQYTPRPDEMKGHAYCRLEAESPGLGRLISNPIFVTLSKSKALDRRSP